MKKEIINGIVYVSVLVFLLIFFYSLKKYIEDLDDNDKIKYLDQKFKIYFEYGYMMSYAMMLSILVFFGFKHLKYFTTILVVEPDLANLLSASIVQVFALGYSTFIEKTMEILIGSPLLLTPQKNLIGFIIGRFTMLLIMIIIIKSLKK